jgi:hypothetical protein
MRGWEDLQSCFQSRSNDVGRLVAWYKKRGVEFALDDIGIVEPRTGSRRRWIRFAKEEERYEGVTSRLRLLASLRTILNAEDGKEVEKMLHVR